MNKKSKSMIFLIVGALLIGIALLMLWMTMSGMNIAKWLVSPMAILVYLVVLLLGTTFLVMWYRERK